MLSHPRQPPEKSSSEVRTTSTNVRLSGAHYEEVTTLFFARPFHDTSTTYHRLPQPPSSQQVHKPVLAFSSWLVCVYVFFFLFF